MPAGSLGAVPRELRDEPRWVCWRRQERGGRMTKLPVDARTGRMAKSTDPATWATFGEAVAAQARWHADGVGFVFGPDRAYTGLDLDHVMPQGELLPEYRWVVDEAGTYCEVSPSSDGLHLIFRGPKPEGATRCRRGQDGGQVVEMYDHDRFFTVTGNVFERHGDMAENPEVVERAYRTWIEPEEAAPQATIAEAPKVPQGPGTMTDDELVERMCASKGGAAIRALLDGDTSAHGGDHSAADMALCSHLAFWCAGDTTRMDRIFRRSGLMRPKWDTGRGGTTYGAQTIGRAVRNCREFYEPRGRAAAAARGATPDGNTCSTPPAKSVTDGEPEEATLDPDRPPAAEGWAVDGRGRLWAADRDGTLRYSVTSTPPWVASDLLDVDTGDVRSLVRVRVRGHVVERALDRDVLLNQSRVVGALAPMGATVSTANAKDVVRYLTDCEKRWGEARPIARSTRHLGWADAPLGAFMPYDAGGDVRFDPSPDEAAKARPFAEPAGTLEGWLCGVGPAREASMAFRCMLAASFASPLVSVVGAQPFLVYLWGRSRSGKTPTLKAAGSVWGDPTEGTDSYFRTFADTPKSIVRAAALLHDIPLIVDELQSKGAPGGQAGKRQVVEDLLYSLSIGHERGALNADRSMMRAGSWRCLTLATGEIPIVGDSTQQGAANRTLELSAEPFADVRAAQLMHRVVAEEHGTAGRAYVAALRRNGTDFYRRQLASFRERVSAVALGHPQADNVALIALADALAAHYVFSGREEPWRDCVEGAMRMAEWALANSRGATEGDTDLKAVQFVSEWLARNRIHFADGCEGDRLERWGTTEVTADRQDLDWYVFSSVLGRALEDAGYDRQKTLRRMDEEGLLVRGSGRGLTRQRRFAGGTRVRCVCIRNGAMESFLDRALGGTQAVTTSREAGPC